MKLVEEIGEVAEVLNQVEGRKEISRGAPGEVVLNGIARVIERSGKDVTQLYVNGAYITLDKAIEIGATIVVLKENSPSCGSSMIYNGEFIGKRVLGNGVTSALLKRNGLRVISEEQFAKGSY